MASIYKIINLINGKIYIGQTIGNLSRRLCSHRVSSKNSNQIIHRAIRKYGFDNFKCEEIENCTIEELNDREIYWIKFYNSTNSLIGYNVDLGGCFSGRCLSPITKEKISKANSGINSTWWGKHHTTETKEKISKANKGIKPSGELWYSKIAEKKGFCPPQLEYKKTPIKCLNNNKEYSTVTEACIELGLNSGNISNVLSGKYTHTKCYSFIKLLKTV